MIKRYFRKLRRSKLFLLFILGLSVKSISATIHWFDNTKKAILSSYYWESGILQTSIIAVPLLFFIIYFSLRLKRKRALNSVKISDNRKDYVINKEDYKRNNPRDAEYRKKYVLSLLRVYDNKCAKCGAMDNGLDLDHFVFSKSHGGNFSMLHKKGYFINNAIPLCQHCNRSKSNRSYKKFFTEPERQKLFTKNKEMTLLINQDS